MGVWDKIGDRFSDLRAADLSQTAHLGGGLFKDQAAYRVRFSRSGERK